MNVFLISIWLMATIFYVSYVVTDLQLQREYLKGKNYAVLIPSSVCQPDLNSIPILNNLNSKCCLSSDGEETGNRFYVDQESGMTFEIGTFPKYYSTVCTGACPEGISPGGAGCINNLGNANYQKCVERLKPEKCKSSANPLVRKGNQLWYAQNYGSSNCKSVQNCSGA